MIWPWTKLDRLRAIANAAIDEVAEVTIAHQATISAKNEALERQRATIRGFHEREDRVPILEAELGRARAEIAGLRNDVRQAEAAYEGLRVQLAKFDHDGDGKAGGSKKRGGK